MRSEGNSGIMLFLEVKGSAKICFHPKQTTTGLKKPGSKGGWDNTRNNCKLTLGLVLQTIALEPLIFGLVEGLHKITTRSNNFWFWSCTPLTELTSFCILNHHSTFSTQFLGTSDSFQHSFKAKGPPKTLPVVSVTLLTQDLLRTNFLNILSFLNLSEHYFKMHF